MQQLELEADANLADAISSACNAVGRKSIAKVLWPEKTVESARKTLDDCLNPDRRDKLSIEQIELIMSMARQQDCHAAMNYLAGALNYRRPVPITPESEKERLQRAFIAAQQSMQSILREMKKLPGIEEV